MYLQGEMTQITALKWEAQIAVGKSKEEVEARAAHLG